MPKDEIDLTFVKLAMENRDNLKHKEELEEVYINNRTKINENRHKKYLKSQIIKKQKSRNKKIIAALIISGIAVSSAIASEYSQQKICDRVVESGIIPQGLSIRNDSTAGRIISYEDEFGNRQTMFGEYFAYTTLEKGEKLGYSVDELAIALDQIGACHADTIENSTLLGRLNEEMKELTHQNEEKISGGRRL